MKKAHRAVRFGPHMLAPGDIIASDGEPGRAVSPEEMAHHLNAGHAEAIHSEPERAVVPEPEKAVEPPPIAAKPPPEEPGERPPKRGRRVRRSK